MAQNIRTIARRTRRNLFGMGVFDELSADWDSTIQQFQDQRAELDRAEQALYDIYPQVKTPEDLDEWQSVFDKVNAAKSAMDAVGSVATSASDFWDTATSYIPGMSGIRRHGIAGSLGFLPALPISIGALLALIGSAGVAIAAAYGFISYIDAKNRTFDQYIAAGMDPSEAAEQARKDAVAASGYSFSGKIVSAVKWGSIGLLAIFVLPKLVSGR